ncbi:MAG TPA: alpha-ketoacid dehydrogenase subunit beta [Chloroflexota bacterium]|nr:alpha-ketoacid dehydrogenase subunit beta [Chloroflexota bacterium]
MIKTVLQALHDALWDEMERDERVVIMGEDVGVRGGVFRATEGFYERFGEARVVDTPLAEGAIVGVAIGAAAAGLLPVAEIQFADFIYPAYDQIVSEAARMRYRSRGAWGCPIVIRAPFGGGIHGGLHHSQCPEALFTHIPGLKVVAPSTAADMAGLIKSAIRDPDPVIFFEHKKTYRSVKGEVPDGDYTVPIGKASIARRGSDISILTYGQMLHDSLAAAERAEAEGVSVEVVDLRTLVPLDKQTILDSVGQTGKAVIVSEANLTSGFGAELAAVLSAEAFDCLDGPIMRVASPDIPAMPYDDAMEEFCLPNPDKILDALRALAAY